MKVTAILPAVVQSLRSSFISKDNGVFEACLNALEYLLIYYTNYRALSHVVKEALNPHLKVLYIIFSIFYRRQKELIFNFMFLIVPVSRKYLEPKHREQTQHILEVYKTIFSLQ